MQVIKNIYGKLTVDAATMYVINQKINVGVFGNTAVDGTDNFILRVYDDNGVLSSMIFDEFDDAVYTAEFIDKTLESLHNGTRKEKLL